MKSFAAVLAGAAFAVTVVSAAEYATWFYSNSDCNGEASLRCNADPNECCNAPSGSNSVYIQYTGSSSVAAVNWALSPVTGCSRFVQSNTVSSGSGPFGTGCYTAEGSSIGSVALYPPES